MDLNKDPRNSTGGMGGRDDGLIHPPTKPEQSGQQEVMLFVFGENVLEVEALFLSCGR